MAKKRRVVSKKVERAAPTGVKIISVLEYISSAVFILMGVLLLIVGIVINADPTKIQLPNEVLSNFPDMGSFLVYLGPLLIALGVVLMLLSILSFFVAYGLWKGKNWARIMEIVFSVFFFVSAFFSLFRGENFGDFFSSLLNLVFSGAIGGYLLFNKKAKKFFGR
jgi:hypothetical protein